MANNLIYDRVKELSTTVGTGFITLSGSPTGYQSFAVVGTGGQTYYCITDQTNWEFGVGIYMPTGSSGTLTRSPNSSSNLGQLVDFPVGTKDVFLPLSASWANNQTLDNVIINGDFDIWQRGTTFNTLPSSGTNFYTADRFYWFAAGAGVITIARDTSVPSGGAHLSNYSLKMSVPTNDAVLAGTDRYLIITTIEGYNWKLLAQQPFTLSFWVRVFNPSVGAPMIFSVAFLNSGQDKSYVAEFTVKRVDAWEKKVITVPISPSAGTWDYTNGSGLLIVFCAGASSAYQTPAGVWTGGAAYAGTNQINGVNDTSCTYYLSQVKLETGNVATQFVNRSFEQESALCQRYYCKTFALGTIPTANQGAGAAPGVLASVAVGASTQPLVNWRFPVAMRTTPTMKTYNVCATSGGAAQWTNDSLNKTATLVRTTSNEQGGTIDNTGTAIGATLDNWIIHASADAEL